MKIKRVKVTSYKEYAFCECGGKMKFTGRSYPTFPEQYVHRCEVCEIEKTALKVYPIIIYIDD